MMDRLLPPKPDTLFLCSWKGPCPAQEWTLWWPEPQISPAHLVDGSSRKREFKVNKVELSSLAGGFTDSYAVHTPSSLCGEEASSPACCASCAAEMFLLLSGFSLLLSRFCLKPSEGSRPLVAKSTTDSMATSEAAADAGAPGVAPPEAGLSPADAPSAGDSGAADWEFELCAFELEEPPWEDVRLLVLGWEDCGLPLLVGVLDLEPLRFPLDNSSWRLGGGGEVRVQAAEAHQTGQPVNLQVSHWSSFMRLVDFKLSHRAGCFIRANLYVALNFSNEVFSKKNLNFIAKWMTPKKKT